MTSTTAEQTAETTTAATTTTVPTTTTVTTTAEPTTVATTTVTATPAERITPAEKTGARTPEAAEVITGARERIDALDDRIIGLIQERTAVSAVIQDTRIASGGRRVNLSREMEVLGHYSDALGRPGTALAMTLLELCRGRI
ncbi:chorismate mutase [Streptomyces sp. NPDC091279]|uniref:chorismate mutase n=1 Tax=unclassified Streptomyces TaxID=2593676 RepID=UPI00380891C2